jgi:very-short-patch-repair endonuclease
VFKSGVIKKKLGRRARRIVRIDFRKQIESGIKRMVGRKEYAQLQRCMTPVEVHSRQRKLNQGCFKSERLFVEKLKQNEIYDFYPNMVLLNRYFGDIVFPVEGVVVEVDGRSHVSASQKQWDLKKDTLLRYFGYRVLRFNSEDEGQADIVIKEIIRLIPDIKRRLPKSSRAEYLPPAFSKGEAGLLRRAPRKRKDKSIVPISKDELRTLIDSQISEVKITKCPTVIASTTDLPLNVTTPQNDDLYASLKQIQPNVNRRVKSTKPSYIIRKKGSPVGEDIPKMPASHPDS